MHTYSVAKSLEAEHHCSQVTPINLLKGRDRLCNQSFHSSLKHAKVHFIYYLRNPIFEIGSSKYSYLVVKNYDGYTNYANSQVIENTRVLRRRDGISNYRQRQKLFLKAPFGSGIVVKSGLELELDPSIPILGFGRLFKNRIRISNTIPRN